MDVDPITGLPKELGVFEELSKDREHVVVFIEKRKFGKRYTVLQGFDKKTDVKDLSKKLKSKFACGGTGKDGQIELQGDHRSQMKDALIGLGYRPDNIEIK